MADAAYRAAVQIQSDIPSSIVMGVDLPLTVAVTNVSDQAWEQARAGAIRLGNHWLSATGHAMLIQDDARATLPETLAPGQACRVTLTVSTPREPGEYQLECDIVHEGISWFGDRGSTTSRTKVRVAGETAAQSEQLPEESIGRGAALSLPDPSSIDAPGPLPMHGIHRDDVLRAIAEHGGTLVHDEIDERCGSEWVGYRYFVRVM